MNRLRALVVDDEPLARVALISLLKRESDVELIGECASAEQAVHSIKALTPDVVFLDVEMPEMDGFDVLEALGTCVLPIVVLVTAFDRYAVQAFETGVLDYLLKPFDRARLSKCLVRIREKIIARTQAPPRSSFLVVKNAGTTRFIPTVDIDWIDAQDYYACLHVRGKEHLIRRSLTELHVDLDEQLFVRIHRSIIVQLDRIRALKLNEAGEYDVVLVGGEKLRLSRRYRKALQERLKL